MAFNWPVFKTRALSAMVFVAVMLAGLMTSPWLFLLLFSVIHWGCWKEYQELMGKIQPTYREISPFHRYGVIIAGWCMILFASSDQWKIGTVSISAIGFWIIFQIDGFEKYQDICTRTFIYFFKLYPYGPSPERKAMDG
jgi:phosphatidate cytidylyltransferase